MSSLLHVRKPLSDWLEDLIYIGSSHRKFNQRDRNRNSHIFHQNNKKTKHVYRCVLSFYSFIRKKSLKS